MKFASKFKVLAVALILGAATLPLQGIAAPTTAKAGVVGSIKGAAKSVGGAVKTAAKAVGSTSKQVVVGSGRTYKRVAGEDRRERGQEARRQTLMCRRAMRRHPNQINPTLKGMKP